MQPVSMQAANMIEEKLQRQPLHLLPLEQCVR